jgi:HPt (histidine-containing phosphotransfer) domain-containing protein
VAITANAFAEERDRCFEAGMNDHVPKPVNPERLYDALIRWIPPRTDAITEHTGVTAEPPSVGTPAEPDHVLRVVRDIEGLDVEAGLRSLSGSATAYVRVLRQFVERHRTDGEALASALEAGDLVALGALAHSLKGVSATVGAFPLSESAAAVEARAKADTDDEALQAAVAALRQTAEPLIAALDAVEFQSPGTAGEGVPESTETERTAARTALERLIPLVHDHNAEAPAIVDSVRPALAAVIGNDLTDRIAHQIGDFEFDSAVALLDQALRLTEPQTPSSGQ